MCKYIYGMCVYIYNETINRHENKKEKVWRKVALKRNLSLKEKKKKKKTTLNCKQELKTYIHLF